MTDEEPQGTGSTTQPPQMSETQTALNKFNFKNKGFVIAVVAVVVVVAAAVAFILLGQGRSDSGDGYVLSNQKLETVDGSRCITGSVKNTSGHEETFVIRWKLFDSDGEQVGSSMAFAEDVPDGASAPVEGLLLPNDTDDTLEIDGMVESFELEGVYLMKEENARLQAQIAALS